ncbi:unnamed protein product [Hermetia illucens]|uniref:BACK domain-containing protein n=1 Tax=Hermetia illucens TaxID=343691 RepID=A0A7R8YTP8_HERIL|nr:uncharacterized protein LOC119648730 [Hermetia illucens]XP_037906474.1 uncharacterized protein LOC119648730 [Hermetia illucens]CAD7081929.1 unnamed protein product [Hermetia illucens]
MVLPVGQGSDNQHANSRTIIIPSAPPSDGDVIHQSHYIDFIVVNGDDRYVIRCERKAVLESSVELAKVINAGPTSGRRNDNHFIINNVDKHDFELVIRFLETKFIKFRDHYHILRILEVADRYNCPDLVIHIVKELDLQLSSSTVLDVFRSLWYYNSISTNISPPEAPTVKEKKKTKKHQHPAPFTPEEYLAALLNNSLQLIDMQAELILTKSQMLELRFEELEMIAKREALQMQSELVLFNCLADWSVEECKRKKLDPNPENRRRVLGALCYTPRYLTMTTMEFEKACTRVDLLDSAEIALVTAAIKGKKLTNLTDEQNNMLERFRTPRPAYSRLPIHLSDRTNPKNYKKKMRRAERGNDDGCCSNFGLNCLAILACIFD